MAAKKKTAGNKRKSRGEEPITLTRNQLSRMNCARRRLMEVIQAAITSHEGGGLEPSDADVFRAEEELWQEIQKMINKLDAEITFQIDSELKQILTELGLDTDPGSNHMQPDATCRPRKG